MKLSQNYYNSTLNIFAHRTVSSFKQYIPWDTLCSLMRFVGRCVLAITVFILVGNISRANKLSLISCFEQVCQRNSDKTWASLFVDTVRL